MRPRKILLGSLLLLIAGALWYLGKTDVSPPNVGEGPATVSETQSKAKEAPTITSVPEVKPMAVAETAPKSEEIPAWELKIDDALRSNADTASIAQVLLQQVPNLPGEGQLASARHIVNLMPDKDYLSVLPYVRNAKLDPGFQEVVVSDAFNRPDSVKLPLLLAAAQTPKHPMAEIAKSTLGFLLDANFENDWGKWEAAVKEALAKQQQPSLQ
jgi:hypothetical protein